MSKQYSERIGSATSKYISQKGTIKEVILETEESVKDSNGVSPEKKMSTNKKRVWSSAKKVRNSLN